MPALHSRFLTTTVFVVGLAAASACSNSEQAREEAAAAEFRQRLAQNKVDLIYEGTTESLRGKTNEAEFRKLLAQTQVLGILQNTERAHYTRTPMAGADLILTFYNSRFTKGNCLESFTWRTTKDGLKLEAYSCAPNMQVTCTPLGSGSSRCETSPVPPPGFAG
jgi:hypothetical protein